MIDPATQAILEEVVRRQSRSLMQYVGDAFPWTTPDERAALTRLRRLINEDRRATSKLLEFLARRRVGSAYLGSFPNWFTTINFVSLDHLLPRLVDEQRQAVAELERARERLADEEARGQVEQLLGQKRRHLQELETLAVAHAEPAAKQQCGALP